jgi:hypothetical protein
VFDLNETDRLKKWKEFRNNLENSATPFEDVALLWSNAPFVNDFLNPLDNQTWPDPWRLIIDNRFDELGIVLGMCYTLQLTERFKSSRYEIHMSMPNLKRERKFFLVVDNGIVLNWTPRAVSKLDDITVSLTKIWQS